MNLQDDFFTVEAVAEKLKVSERYVNACIREGKLKAYKQGKRHYIFFSDLVNFIKTEHSENENKDTTTSPSHEETV